MKIGLLALLFSVPILLFSQEKEPENTRTTDIKFTFGRHSSNFRDFATSPLIYQGSGLYFSVSKKKADINIEKEIGIDYSSGNCTNSTNRHSSTSQVTSVNAYYSKLYTMKKWSNDNWNVKIGGELNVAGNLRQNLGLQNNSTGIELIPTLFGSIKATTDISNSEAKRKKLLFIKYNIPVRTRYLAFKLNVGLINSSYRNGYAYIGQTSVLNDTKVFDDYSFSLGTGMRLGSAVDYTVVLKNGNKIQWSYVWNAYKTGGDFESIEMAQHIFKISFLFNKKRQ